MPQCTVRVLRVNINMVRGIALHEICFIYVIKMNNSKKLVDSTMPGICLVRILTLARTHACTHSRSHARMHACTHVRMHTYSHERMHACTQALMHSRPHALTYSRVQKNTCVRSPIRSSICIRRGSGLCT